MDPTVLRLIELTGCTQEQAERALAEADGKFEEALRILENWKNKEMANYTAADVKKLREETDAPMMECKSALEEAGGDFERAKEILREKGKAAAGKKAGRSTGAGVVAFATSPDLKAIAGVVLECETDFVSRNEGFIELAQRAADALSENPNADLKEIAEEAIAKYRENCLVGKTARHEITGFAHTYVHHDRSKGALVIAEGEHANTDAVRKVAIQIVSLPPEVVSKDQLSQDMLDHEIEVETQRAINEGKPEAMAKNIAQGRVNKEYIKRVVLNEQPLYLDPSKSVSQYLAEEAKGAKIVAFDYLAIGQGS